MATAEDCEIQRLRCRLKEAEEAMQKAAQYGLQLLDCQLELQNKLEEQRTEMTNSIEALEQEKYSLQREVELRGRILDSLRSECETIKMQQKVLWEQQEAQLERSHALEVNDYKNKMERMKAELDETRLSEKQLRHKLELQAESLSSKTEELRALTERTHETMSSEMLELQMEKIELETAKADLEHELNEMRYREQQLQLANTNLQRKVERLSDEKEEREKEAISYFNGLEKAREANQDLQLQLDQLLQQSQDPNSKGNSLFSEVEDRRAEMERQLISMKVQHQSLQKQHAFSRQQLHRMKVQIATLMQLKGSHADPGQLERLQSMLSQKNNEIEALMIKLRRLEKVEMTVKAEPSCMPSELTESGDGTYYTDLLKMQLSNSMKEVERIGEELSLQRMKALAESQRVLEVERRLFSSERTLKLCQSDNIKLQVKLDEIRMKYEPSEVNRNRVQKRRREKLPVDVPSQGSELKEWEQGLADSGPAETIEPEPEPEPQTCTVERQVMTPLQQVQTQEPSTPQPHDSKCVRICEEPPSAHVASEPPRSPSAESTIKTEEQMGTGAENRRLERKQQQKPQPVIHVSSKPTLENQCAQQ
ncbi:protein Spindly [Amia ocellicauda]|uniref:protein Spindly n=1 Tax=Amia ocellicauda TaxID=2972642 RepID=UPI0034643658